MYLLDLAFFGLTSTYRIEVFKQIHEIVFHGKGGYTWSDVYSMPIWLRKFTFSQLKEYYDKEAKEYSSRKTADTSKITRPDIDPTYKSTVSKK